MVKLNSLSVKVCFRYVDDTLVFINSKEQVEEVMNFLVYIGNLSYFCELFYINFEIVHCYFCEVVLIL